MSNKPFVHLHVHTHFSLLDGLAKPADLAMRAKELGMNSLAITDHGTMYGAFEFYKACRAEGIKPIIGCECFVAIRSLSDKESGIDNKRYHLVLLTKNEEGYRNLVQLVSTAYLEGMYYKPRIDFELLKKHSNGLVALSACLGGEVSRAVVNSDEKKAKEVAQKYKDLFGKDFYLELQNHPGIPDQARANEALIKISKELDIPLIATNDIHYTRKEDQDAHDTLICIQTNSQKDSEDRMSMTDADFSMKSPKEMYETLPAEACENTQKIADMCNFEFKTGENHLPSFPTDDGSLDEEFLVKKCKEGVLERFGFDAEKPETDEQKAVIDRLNHELEVINNMGFPSYFLIVWDFVKWAREQKIAVGPGRGSAAGSIVSYLLKITDIDPLKYELYFERFLNPERVSMPDIDLDFADDRRDEVINYVRDKYGRDRVAQICTFGTMAAKAAVKDVGRAYGVPFGEMNDFVKLISDRPGTKLKEAEKESNELREDLKSNAVHKKIFETAKKLEGCVRHVSVHACAVVIAPDNIMNYTPLQYPPKDDSVIITQFSAKPIDALGLLKMDFLGLKNLTILEKAKKIIKRTRNEEIEMDSIPLDDKKTYKLLAEGKTTGVFQLESSGMRRYLKELKPTDFEDIIAMVSLYRPGPMEWIPDYIKGKHGKKKVKYIDESLRPVLEKTFGIGIYQEQILKIAQVFGGFTLGQADILRRAIGKKIPEELASQRKRFIEGAVEKGHKKEVAINIFDKVIEPFAGYGFNRSHAACYAMIAYQTAYLKANYPVEFMAALLSSDAQNSDRVCRDIEECEVMNIKILPPSVNDSLKNFTVVDKNSIRFGLTAIKGIGDSVVNEIINEREKSGEYKSLEDFVLRIPAKAVNKKSLEALAKAGALIEFADPKIIIEHTEMISRFAREHSEENINSAQVGLFGVEQEESVKAKMNFNKTIESTEAEKLAWEKETMGLYVSDHPLKNMENYFAKKGILIKKLQNEEGDFDGVSLGGIVANFIKRTTKKGDAMCVLTLEDPSGKIDVVVFPRAFVKHAETIEKAEILLIKGKWDLRHGQVQIIGNSFQDVSFEKAKKAAAKLPKYEPESEKEALVEKEEVCIDEKCVTKEPYVLRIPAKTKKSKLKKINDILLKHTGDSPVEIQINGEILPYPKRVEISEEFKKEVAAILV